VKGNDAQIGDGKIASVQMLVSFVSCHLFQFFQSCTSFILYTAHTERSFNDFFFL